ncbi:MAG: hypothetical protein HOP30_13685 [Cyclobacteriaceae bacterium]|nr:hypothetical protein [Cyclobacteriaceae bacterium]
MKFRWILLIFMLTPSKHMVGQQLSGQVFILAERYNNTTCEIVADCDCCASDLFFLNGKDFALINRCLFNDTYFKGTYQINKGKLTLNFKQMHVVELMNEETNKITHTVTKTKIAPYVFSIDMCEKKIRLTHFTIKDFSNGFRYSPENEKELNAKLNKSEAWKLISK